MKTLSVESLLAASPPWTHHRESANPIIVSSRIRLARNLRGMPFPLKTGIDTRQMIAERVVDVVDDLAVLEDPGYAAMEDLSETERNILYERHLVSAEMTRLGRGAGVAVDATGLLALMLNEEDHLRIHALSPGLQLDPLWATVYGIESALADELPFAFRSDLGYLTACPTNVGTGMRASVMLHLAALDLQGELEAVMRGAKELGMAMRGAFGEGSQPSGGLVQISNQSTLGEDEPTVLRRLTAVVQRLVEAEHGTRQQLLYERDAQLYDSVGRALGTLRYARRMSSEEAFGTLGELRLGAECGLLPNVSADVLDDLLTAVQPGHLRLMQDPDADQSTRDTLRATLIRQRLFPKEAARK